MNVENSLSALNALGTTQQVSANNVANVNTDEFSASRVALETGPEGQGVRVGAILRDESPGPQVDGVRGSNTDVATEMVSMMRTQTAFGANVAAVRAQEELTGHVLNLVA